MNFLLLAPALVLAGTLVLAFGVYCVVRPEVGKVKHNQLFGPFLAGFLVWVLGPAERMLRGRVSPNAITAASLVMCGATGLAVALGSLEAAVSLYVLAGILDVLDGRLARLDARQTPAGALLDSVSDRWGELAVLTGYAWYLRESAWLLGVMAAIGGSMMVSYTRARSEGLGLPLTGGLMQRAERIVLVAAGTLGAAIYVLATDNAPIAADIVGVTLALCGALSIATAVRRWQIAYRGLAAAAAAAEAPAAEAAAVVAVPAAPRTPAPVAARTSAA